MVQCSAGGLPGDKNANAKYAPTPQLFRGLNKHNRDGLWINNAGSFHTLHTKADSLMPRLGKYNIAARPGIPERSNGGRMIQKSERLKHTFTWFLVLNGDTKSAGGILMEQKRVRAGG